MHFYEIKTYIKKDLLYELLKFGFLSEFGSDFIECRESHFNIKSVVKDLFIDFIKHREDITCFLHLFDLSKKDEFFYR